MESIEMRYSGFWIRFIAYIIDTFFNYWVFFAGSMFLLVYISNNIFDINIDLINTLTYVISIPLTFTFTIVCWLYWGTTVGKFIVRIRIVDKEGNKLDLEKSIIRNISYILSMVCLLLGFIWIAIDKKKQGWHDKLAQSFVIKM